jgi:carboxymethylenebutenolidase
MTPEALGELNQTLDAAGVSYTSEIYPGTVHGFTMSDTDAFSAPGSSATGTACCPSWGAP